MKRLYLLLIFPLTLFSQNGFYTSQYTLNSTISSLTNTAIDKNGEFWTGLNYINSNYSDFMHYAGSWTLMPTPFTGITGNKNNCVAADTLPNIWLGTKNGLAKYDGATWTSYTTSNSSIAGNNVQCIVVDSLNELWIGTTQGLSHFDGTTWLNYTVANSSLSCDSVYSIYVEGPNNIWLGHVSGISNFNSGTFQYFPFGISGIGPNAITGIGRYQNEYYISGKSCGILKFNGSSFSVPPEKTEPFNEFGNQTNFFRLSSHPQSGVLFYLSIGNAIGHFVNGELNYYFLSQNVYSNCKFSTSEMFYPGTNKIITTTVLYPGKTLAYITFNPVNYNGFGLGSYNGANADNFKELAINNVRSGVTNRGDKHWDITAEARYEFPKYSGKHSNFSSNLWLGGIDNAGQLHVAAQTYRQTGCDFWPGPLDTVSASTDSASALNYDKVWKVNIDMLVEFQQEFASGNVQNGSYDVPNDILTWPAHGSGNLSHTLAPFVDVNGNGIYDPVTGGDYPKIKGDECIYTIYNDMLAPHSTGALPLGVEVHYYEYAYYCSLLPDSLQALNNTTFHDFEIINRSINTYDSVYFGWMQDSDMGNYIDDQVSAIPQENYAVIFNGDNNDEYAGVMSTGTYGSSIPMQAMVFLDGAPANYNDTLDNDNNGLYNEPGEKCLFTNMTPAHYNGQSCGNMSPGNPSDFYNLLQSFYPDSTHVQNNGWCNTGAIDNFYQRGYPYNTPLNSPMGDRSLVAGSGPFQFAAGDTIHYLIALVNTLDTTTQLMNGTAYNAQPFQKNLSDVQRIKQWHANNSFPSCAQLTIGAGEKQTDKFEVFPNPSSGEFFIRGNELGGKKYVVTDVGGREVLKGKSSTAEMKINLSGFGSGVYFMVTEGGTGLKLIKQ